MKRGNIVASRGIWVPREWDIAQIPEYLSPVTAEEIINTGVLRRSGRITCRAALERKAFVRGENIKCRLEIENGDSNPIIDVRWEMADINLIIHRDVTVFQRNYGLLWKNVYATMRLIDWRCLS